MSNPLDLFPPRIRIADANGMMTPEFYRALQTVFKRLGGAASDSTPDSSSFDVMQPFNDLVNNQFSDIQQPTISDNSYSSETSYARI